MKVVCERHDNCPNVWHNCEHRKPHNLKRTCGKENKEEYGCVTGRKEKGAGYEIEWLKCREVKK